MAERSEAKCAKRSFVSKIKILDILRGRIASRFKLRFAQPFYADSNEQLIGHFPRMG